VKFASLFPVLLLLTATVANASADWSTERKQTERKLDSIVIPEIRFKDTPVREAFALLAQQSTEHDQGSAQDERGVQIILKIDEKAEDTLVNLNLDNMSLREALRYTCILAGLKFQADNRVVIVALQSDPTIAP
jgi:hypothetical protein